MIDTDKYEGHTEGPWDWFPRTNDSHIGHLERHSNLTRVTAEIKSRSAENDANAQLIADAPLLLAEVERLREELRVTQSNFSMVRNALANQYPELEEAIWKVIE
jgi:hypothetical protein